MLAAILEPPTGLARWVSGVPRRADVYLIT